MRRLRLAAALLTLAPLAAAPARGQDAPTPIKVVAADGSPVAGVRAWVRGAAQADSASADSAGRLPLRIPASAAGDSLELWTYPADHRFLPAYVRATRRELERGPTLVLVPRRWTVEAGTHAGKRVGLSMRLAYRESCRGCSGFLPLVAAATPGALPLQAWPEGRFPLRVAFDREEEAVRISPRDSVAFWKGVDALEATIGRDLFRPATYLGTLPDDQGGPDDVVLVRIDPELRYSGRGTVIGSATGEITYGAVRFRNPWLLAASDGPRLVAHEMMHVLGFGHTCAWRSVLADLNHCEWMKADEPSPEDVAHAGLARRVAALRRGGARWGLEATLAGESRPVPTVRPAGIPAADPAPPDPPSAAAVDSTTIAPPDSTRSGRS